MNFEFHYFAFQIFPYIALVFLMFGSIVRFDRDPYSWRSKSSQILRRHKQFIWGSALFHIGILIILFGHLVGLSTPIWVFDMMGVSHTIKQLMAIVIGGIAGVLALIGLILLIHRRLFDDRVRANSSFWDIAILFFLLAQLLLGLYTIPASLGHLDGHEMVKYMNWVQHVITFRPGAAEFIRNVPWQFQAHIVLGLTIFIVFPFTRLVHFWSAPFLYLFRRQYQIVRKRET